MLLPTKTKLLILLLAFTVSHLVAQQPNPFKHIGKKTEVIDLSKGKYVEFIEKDSLERVGTVIVNRVTRKIEGFLNEDSLYRVSIDNTEQSRFFSVDAIAAKYPELSPYQFAGNNPIQFIDLDGEEPENPLARWFATDAVMTIATKPNSTKAQVYGAVIGVGGSIEGTIKGAINIVRHPGLTLKGLWQTVSQGPTQTGFDYATALSQKYGDLPEGVQGTAIKAHAFTDISLILLPFKYKASPVITETIAPGTTTTEIVTTEAVTAGEESVDATNIVNKARGATELASFKSKVQNAFNGIDKQHLDAAIGDLAGKPIVKGGKVWNHLRDISNSLVNLNKRIQELNKLINNDIFEGSALEEAKALNSSLQKQYDSYYGALQRAANKYNKTITVKPAK